MTTSKEVATWSSSVFLSDFSPVFSFSFNTPSSFVLSSLSFSYLFDFLYSFTKPSTCLKQKNNLQCPWFVLNSSSINQQSFVTANTKCS